MKQNTKANISKSKKDEFDENPRNFIYANPYLKKHFNYFLKEVFNGVTGEKEYDYIDYKLGFLANSMGLEKHSPGYQIRPALNEMLEKKVSLNSILDLVRVVQSDILYHVFLTLENGLFQEKGNWGFYIENKDGEPIYKIGDGVLTGQGEDEFLPREIKKVLKEKEAKRKLVGKTNTKVSKVTVKRK